MLDGLCSRIEDAGLNASAPPEQRWLDGWLLRLCPGKAKRARCINALAPGRLPLSERLALAARAYRDAGLPLILRCTPYTPDGLEAALAGQGWRRFDDSRVLCWRDFRVEPAATPPAPVPCADYAEVIGALRGSSPAQRRAHAQRLAASPVPYRGFVWREGGEVLACGQVALEADLVGLYDVFVAAAARGHGRATALCHWLLAQAAVLGARHAYLQVDADNQPALAVYARMGFVDAYRYHYLTPESGPV